MVRRLGRLWLIDPSDLLDLRLWAYRDVEPEARGKLIDLARRAEATRFFDIGANAGTYSVILAGEAPGLERVDAFEPARATNARLTANIWMNGLTQKITPHRMALGAEAGELEFFMPVGISGGATLAAEVAEKGGGVVSEVVPVRRFDDLFQIEGARLLFKIDVETTEDKVIEGMRAALAANRCVLQIELWPKKIAMITELLAGLGYAKIGEVTRDSYFSNIPDLSF